MAGRKLVRDLLISRQPLLFRLTSQQQVPSSGRLRLLTTNEHLGRRQFSVFNEFSKQIKGEAERNQEFKKSVKELKEKAEELKGVKEDLKVRTKQTTEKLYKQVDGVWTEAEATAKKVSSSVKEKISAATEEVKESFGFGKQESSGSTGTSAKDDAGAKNDGKTSSGEATTSGEGTASEETHKQNETGQTAETFFGKFKSSIPSSAAFQKLKEAKVTDVLKKGYDVVKDEIYGNTSRKKHLECTPPPAFTGEISSRTDIVVQPTKQTIWGKKWDAFREKMRGHPLFKHFTGISEPVVTKGQEIAEDMRERWETSDSPIVHKIQDVSDTIFQETDAASSFKEISRRDPSFSMMDFVAEVQEAIRPVLNAYYKGDVKTLKKYCSPEVIDRCLAERNAFQSHGFFFDNKILHISEVEVRYTKLMGTSPIIIIAFQTQQIHCARDKHGEITEGGKDTIHTVYYMWAMQQVDPEELGEGAIYPIWRLREMQRLGFQALI